MRDLSNSELEEVGSEMENDSVLEEGSAETGLDRLIADFLSAPDPNNPNLDLVGRLYVRFFQRVVSIFQRRPNDRRLAEDATQQAFVALQNYYTKHGALPDKIGSFLFIAARNWLVNQARTPAARHEVPLVEQSSSTLDELLDPRAEARQPFEAVASDEIKMTANRALEKLDATTHQIIQLHREGKSWPEVAALLSLSNGEIAKKKFQHAVHCVRGALGEQFSSFVTTADPEVRRWINSRKAAEQAIDLLPPPYDELLRLLLVENKTDREVAQLRNVPLDSIRRDRERGAELLTKKYKLTENEILELLRNGR